MSIKKGGTKFLPFDFFSQNNLFGVVDFYNGTEALFLY